MKDILQHHKYNYIIINNIFTYIKILLPQMTCILYIYKSVFIVKRD